MQLYKPLSHSLAILSHIPSAWDVFFSTGGVCAAKSRVYLHHVAAVIPSQASSAVQSKAIAALTKMICLQCQGDWRRRRRRRRRWWGECKRYCSGHNCIRLHPHWTGYIIAFRPCMWPVWVSGVLLLLFCRLHPSQMMRTRKHDRVQHQRRDRLQLDSNRFTHGYFDFVLMI